MKYYSAAKWDNLLIHRKTWMNLKLFAEIKKSHLKNKLHYFMSMKF